MGSVEDGVRRDLEALPAALRVSGLAESALAIARELDVPGNSATSKAMCARALAESLERLRALAPAREEADRVDDLASRRAKRRSTAARKSGS